FVFFGLPLALLAGALAFYPINNRPFSYFLEAIFNYITKQHLYLWRKKSDVVHKSFSPIKPVEEDISVRAQMTTKKNISSLARRLELQALQKPE
ncbi:hypothetical protein GW766_03685, partial [Candidatus Parcubacteria bacterium]|nr:hypothetical protein [Candidatus Parcubacteria bacterium]